MWTEWSDLHLSMSCWLQFHSWGRAEYGEQLLLTLDNRFFVTYYYLFIYLLTCVCQTFHGCTCIQSWGLTSGNSSAVLGQCSRASSCTKMFYIYLALQALAFFVYCLGTVPFFIISLRFCFTCFHHISMQLLHIIVPYIQLHLLYLIQFHILYNL